MPALGFLDYEIQRLEEAGLLRTRPGPTPDGATLACSNDYLGYNNDPLPLGASGSRLVVGDHPEHARLERLLASWVRMPDALLLSSGFCANLALASCLPGPGDTVVSFNLNHASIIDGCRLSKATVRVVAVNDLDAVARALQEPARRRWLITESYFSMDGLVADLQSLRLLCDRAGAAMIVDEAHALGVFGPSGAGQCEAQDVRPDVLMGTLGKAIGGQGAFVAAPPGALLWFWNRARPFVFSTGVSPWLCSRLSLNVSRAMQDHGARTRLAQNCARFRATLSSLGIRVAPGSSGPIVPVIIGDARLAVLSEQRLRAAGFVVRAIRPPTVPEGTARLRITLNAAMSDPLLDRLAAALRDCL